MTRDEWQCWPRFLQVASGGEACLVVFQERIGDPLPDENSGEKTQNLALLMRMHLNACRGAVTGCIVVTAVPSIIP